MAMVCSGQHARCGGCSDHRGYRGVARMQPSSVPRCKYPDRCEREQSCLGRFAKFGLIREETGDDDSGSDSSHAEEFQFRVGYKRNVHRVHDGGASYLPWLAGSLEECLGEGYWLSFNQRLPISYELGDCLYGLLHRSRLVRDKEDAEGEITEDAVEEEII